MRNSNSSEPGRERGSRWDAFPAVIRDYSRLIIAVFACLTVLAGALASRITIDGSVEHLMMSGDPMRELDLLSKDEFGNDEVLMVAFDLGAPFTEADLRRLAALSESVESLSGVDHVKSLANIEDIRGLGDELDASRLIDFATLSEDFSVVQERSLNHRLYQDLLVSARQDVLGMLVYADNTEANSEALNDMTRAVIAVISETASPWKAHFAGYPVTALEANRIVKHDLGLLTPVALIAIGAILIGFTRRFFPVALMLGLVIWVEAAAHAWLATRGIPLNVVVSFLPTILLATSATYVVYAVGLLSRISDRPDPGVELFRVLARPVLLSGLSTGIGFASLQFIEVKAIGDLGGALAVGMVAAMLGALFLVPAFVQQFDLRIGIRKLHVMRRLALVGVQWARQPWLVVGAAALVIAAAVPGLMRLTVHTDTIDYFAPDNYVRTGSDFFQENLSSAFLMNFVVRTTGENSALDPEVLEFSQRIIDELETHPGVDRTVSMLDYFHLMDAALRPDRDVSILPESREAAAQYLLLYESSGDPEDYDRYINFDRSALSLIVSAHGGSSVYIDAAKRVEALAASAPDGVRVDSLGTMFLYSRAMDRLTRGMLVGLGVAILLVGAVMILGLRSLPLAAIAAIPNLAPLAVCGGVLGWLDVPLSMGTSLVGCLALGLAVDDTAHVMGHLKRSEVLESVYRGIGPALLLTTLVLGVGFSALMLSDFQTVRAIGIATTATLGVALAADLLLLPSLLVLAGYARSEEDRVRFTAGEARRLGRGLPYPAVPWSS